MAGPCAMAGDGSGRERADVGTAMVENVVSMVLVGAGTSRPRARSIGSCEAGVGEKGEAVYVGESREAVAVGVAAA